MFCRISQSPSLGSQEMDSVEGDDDIAARSRWYPFDRPDADLALLSLDGFTFKVHRMVLEMNLNPASRRTIEEVLGTSLDLVPRDHDLPCFALQEDGCTLALLPQMCYPARGGEDIVQWSLSKLRSKTTKRAMHAARGYDFLSILEAHKARLLEYAKKEPFAIFFRSGGMM